MIAQKRKHFKFLLIALLILVLNTQSILLTVQAAPANVSFNLDLNYVKGIFSSDIHVPAGSVEPGKSIALGISVKPQKMTITLTVPNVGQKSMQIDPLGERSYNVPGLFYNYMLVKLGIVLYTKGTITGQLSTTSQGSLDKTFLEWEASDTKSTTLTASPEAQKDDTITVTLSNIKYNLYIEVKAVGEVLGEHYETVLIPYTKVGSVLGTPSTISSSYKIGKAPYLGGKFLLPIMIGVPVAIAIVTIVFALKRFNLKKRPQTSPISPRIKSCPYCGQITLYNTQYKKYYCNRCKKYVK